MSQTNIDSVIKSVNKSSNTAFNEISNKISDNKLQKKYTVKLFYADWCDHCTKFKPIWFKLKKLYSNQINFVEINCSDHTPNLKYVQGYPTISLYNSTNNYIRNYDDNRTFYDFEKFINQYIFSHD